MWWRADFPTGIEKSEKLDIFLSTGLGPPETAGPFIGGAQNSRCNLVMVAANRDILGILKGRTSMDLLYA